MALTGRARAAIFLLSLDEERAVKIIEHLDGEELKILGKTIEDLDPISTEILEQVYEEFAKAYKSGLASVGGGTNYLHGLIAKARGEEEAVRLFAKPPPPPPQPLESFSSADPKMLTNVLVGEHPQVVAAVLAYLDPSISCEVLGSRSIEEQTNLIRRIANLRKIPSAAMHDVENAINALGLDVGEMGEIDGITSAATILNGLIGETATEVLDRLGEEFPDEAEVIKRAMFTFNDLASADTRGLQQMLREIQSDTLLMALKTASDEIRAKIFGCMSQRAAKMLQEELEIMAPVRVADVEAAQQEIVDLAMRLLSEGKLNVEGRGEAMV